MCGLSDDPLALMVVQISFVLVVLGSTREDVSVHAHPTDIPTRGARGPAHMPEHPCMRVQRAAVVILAALACTACTTSSFPERSIESDSAFSSHCSHNRRIDHHHHHHHHDDDDDAAISAHDLSSLARNAYVLR